jgi:hypothetical protein
MKIYLIWFFHAEGQDLEAVYSTRKKAEKAMRELEARHGKSFEIEERVIE